MTRSQTISGASTLRDSLIEKQQDVELRGMGRVPREPGSKRKAKGRTYRGSAINLKFGIFCAKWSTFATKSLTGWCDAGKEAAVRAPLLGA